MAELKEDLKLAVTINEDSKLNNDNHLRSAIDNHRKAIMDEHGFSPRECEVCHAILNGETRASAAKKLFITERTVKFHLENCYKKLGVNSKNELIKRFYVPPSPLDLTE